MNPLPTPVTFTFEEEARKKVELSKESVDKPVRHRAVYSVMSDDLRGGDVAEVMVETLGSKHEIGDAFASDHGGEAQRIDPTFRIR